MLRRAKKLIITFIDWLLYTLLKTEHKRFLSGLLTTKQKEMIKKIIKPGRKRSQVKKIERAKYRLYNLGFTEKGLKELEALYMQTEDKYLKQCAAWELAVYYANQYSAASAEKCLTYIAYVKKHRKSQADIRRAAILQAESYHILDKKEEAKRVIERTLASKKHVDLYLARANVASGEQEWKQWINKAFELYDVTTISLKQETAYSNYDRLETKKNNRMYHNLDETPKVTVIIPVYNAEQTVETALQAMIEQTWTNLEILIVDDSSSDRTKEVVAAFAATDNRIKLSSTKENSGAYTARNEALLIATGDFVTINDADDWSHADKIKIQVTHLMDHPKVMANFSNQARATEDLIFYRRGKPGIYSFPNMSSFMFRRKPVMEKLGYWDCVRFAGDSEFIKRVKLAFGEKSVRQLNTAPLSFQRQSANSLTGNAAFGFPGYFMGARKEYAEVHDYFHQNNKHNLYYPFPMKKRLFPVPEPMLPNRRKHVRKQFDVIIVSEFRLLGGTNMSNIEEIKAQKKLGLRTGLVQMSRFDLNSVREVNPKIREQVDGDQVQMLVYGEKVSCDLLIVRHPPILQEKQKYMPDIEAKHVCVIVNQPPKREYSEEGTTLYELSRCVSHLEDYVGKRGIWYPIGPRIRQALLDHHQDELHMIELADEDWVNIIDVSEWHRSKQPVNAKIRIGRHSRDQYVKWPDDRNELLTIYPDSDKYEIHVLGGAKAPEKVLDELPKNWRVYAFGKINPKDFLATLDVFVYYTHPDWVEAFGRVIFEAMAVGVPVIIPPSYRSLFGEAAIYAKPDEVEQTIDQLMADSESYQIQVEKALSYVEKHFGYAKHAWRLKELHVNGR